MKTKELQGPGSMAEEVPWMRALVREHLRGDLSLVQRAARAFSRRTATSRSGSGPAPTSFTKWWLRGFGNSAWRRKPRLEQTHA
eukprot:3739957-Pyramimonas_sp.AAC.1